MTAKSFFNARQLLASNFMRDAVVGMADGLTVPFALAAGLCGASVASRIVVLAGMAEVVASAIKKGVGGYLAARSEKPSGEYQAANRIDGVLPVMKSPVPVEGASGPTLADGAGWSSIRIGNKWRLGKWISGHALRRALTISGAYVLGGLVPLTPYMLIEGLLPALRVSVICTFLALAIFGAAKSRVAGLGMRRGVFRLVIVDGFASVAAFSLARWISA